MGFKIRTKIRVIENDLLADDGKHFVRTLFLVLGEYGQHAAERTCRRTGHRLGGLLVEVRHVERVLEHLAELAIVDASVWTAIEADNSFAVAVDQLRFDADGQFQRGEELALGDAAAAQSVVVFEELGRSDPVAKHRDLHAPGSRTVTADTSRTTTVLNCDSLSLSLSLSLLSNPDLKLICFLLLSANYFAYLFCQHLCSRLTASWRYINFVLLLLLLLLLLFYY